MSHTMKLWERVIEHQLRHETRMSENQFGFMLGRLTTEAIFLLQMMEKYRKKKKELSMVFMDLEWHMKEYQERSCGGFWKRKGSQPKILTKLRICMME